MKGKFIDVLGRVGRGPWPRPTLPNSLTLIGGGEGSLRGGRGNNLQKIPPTLPSKTCLLLLLLLILAGACGKKMTPLAPDKVLPAAVREFRLSQEGEAVVLSWLLPRENLLGQPLTQVGGCRVYRAEAKGVEANLACPSDFVMLADIDLAYPREGEVQGEALVYQDRALVPERRYWYRVAAYDQDGYLGAWSRVLTRAWGVLPRAPRDLKAEAGDKVVRLSWLPVTQLQDGSPIKDLAGYRIYRRAAADGWLRLNPEPLPLNSFEDLAVFNEVSYTYKVRAVRRLGGELLESADSLTLAAEPQKLTAPPPVLNLVAVATAKGVELRWDPSPATDLAGYRLYRRAAGQEQFVRLTAELLKKPSFVDAQVRKGQTYQYYVTAVDTSRRANESLPSEEAAITF